MVIANKFDGHSIIVCLSIPNKLSPRDSLSGLRQSTEQSRTEQEKIPYFSLFPSNVAVWLMCETEICNKIFVSVVQIYCPNNMTLPHRNSKMVHSRSKSCLSSAERTEKGKEKRRFRGEKVAYHQTSIILLQIVRNMFRRLLIVLIDIMW